MTCFYFSFPFLIQTLTTTPQSEQENKQLNAAVEEEEEEEEKEGSQDQEVPIETKPSDQSNESSELHEQGDGSTRLHKCLTTRKFHLQFLITFYCDIILEIPSPNCFIFRFHQSECSCV